MGPALTRHNSSVAVRPHSNRRCRLLNIAQPDIQHKQGEERELSSIAQPNIERMQGGEKGLLSTVQPIVVKQADVSQETFVDAGMTFDLALLVCNCCKRPGHMKRNCWKLKAKDGKEEERDSEVHSAYTTRLYL